MHCCLRCHKWIVSTTLCFSTCCCCQFYPRFCLLQKTHTTHIHKHYIRNVLLWVACHSFLFRVMICLMFSFLELMRVWLQCVRVHSHQPVCCLFYTTGSKKTAHYNTISPQMYTYNRTITWYRNGVFSGPLTHIPVSRNASDQLNSTSHSQDIVNVHFDQ